MKNNKTSMNNLKFKTKMKFVQILINNYKFIRLVENKNNN